MSNPQVWIQFQCQRDYNKDLPPQSNHIIVFASLRQQFLNQIFNNRGFMYSSPGKLEGCGNFGHWKGTDMESQVVQEPPIIGRNCQELRPWNVWSPNQGLNWHSHHKKPLIQQKCEISLPTVLCNHFSREITKLSPFQVPICHRPVHETHGCFFWAPPGNSKKSILCLAENMESLNVMCNEWLHGPCTSGLCFLLGRKIESIKTESLRATTLVSKNSRWILLSCQLSLLAPFPCIPPPSLYQEVVEMYRQTMAAVAVLSEDLCWVVAFLKVGMDAPSSALRLWCSPCGLKIETRDCLWKYH